MKNTPKDKKEPCTTQPFVIILDDLDFTFTPSEVTKAAALWESGSTHQEIADTIRPRGNRQIALDETELLFIHLRRSKQIKRRR